MADFKINPDDECIEIPNSKLKVLLLLLGSLGFIALGIWVISHPEMLQSSYRPRPKLEIVLIGYLTTIFSGIGVIGCAYTLISNKPGFVIDDDGIRLANAFGRDRQISWFEIKSFDINSFNNVAFISIQLNDAEKYISEEKNAVYRSMMKLNIRQSGAPLNISTTAFKCDFNQLYDLLCSRLADFKAAEIGTSRG